MIIIRADGNAKIGSGHIMRCLSVADAFKKKGEESLFVMADDSLQTLVESRGYRVVVLDSAYNDLEGETDKIKEMVTRVSPKLILADSYYVTHDYLQALCQLATVAYMDDVLAFAYPVDILINYNVFSNRVKYDALYSGSSVRMPKLLLGTAYAPLREEFKNIPPRQNAYVNNIFVSSGGADTEHVEWRLVEWLSNHPKEFDTIKFHVVVGAVNQDADRIIQKSSTLKNVVIHRNVKEMQRLMTSCDMAVSAAGSTLYELCACGVPIVTYIVADNQIAAEQEFVNRGIALSTGDIRSNERFIETLMETIAELIHDSEKCRNLSGKAHALVDGFGADKLVAVLMEEIKTKKNIM